VRVKLGFSNEFHPELVEGSLSKDRVLMNKTSVRKKPQYTNSNNIESVQSLGRTTLGGALARSLGDDLIRGGENDVKEQLFGIDLAEHYRRQNITGDLVEGEELILKNSIKPKVDIEPGIDYFKEVIHGEKRIVQENTKETSKKVEEIVVELKRLITASEELKVEFRQVAVEQRIVNPGKYHLNFFEWLLSIIRLARMKIEDSGAWLSAFQSKKAKKQYWAMFKKHGTTFGLSNERVVATQTG